MKTGKIEIDYTDYANPILNIVLENGELWMTEYEMAELLDTYTPTIRAQIKALIKEGFLHGGDYTREHRVIRNGQVGIHTYYNLEILIFLCYRINTGPTHIIREWLKTKYTQSVPAQKKEEVIYTGTGFWKKERRFLLN